MPKYTDKDWQEAKSRCRLNKDDITMAKQLGMTPKSLIKNIPAKNQQWKLSVKEWIRSLYFDKFGHILGEEEDELPF